MKTDPREKISYGSGFNFKKIRNFGKIQKRNNKLTRGTFYGKKWYPYNG